MENIKDVLRRIRTGAPLSDSDVAILGSYIKKLELHENETVGMYVIGKEFEKIFEKIPNEKDCKTVIEAYLVQQINYLKNRIYRIKSA